MFAGRRGWRTWRNRPCCRLEIARWHLDRFGADFSAGDKVGKGWGNVSVEGVNLAAHYSSNSIFAFLLNCHLLALPLPTPSPATGAYLPAQPLVTPKTAYSAKRSKACSHYAAFGVFSLIIDAVM